MDSLIQILNENDCILRYMEVQAEKGTFPPIRAAILDQAG
jgi:hypothetical protein